MIWEGWGYCRCRFCGRFLLRELLCLCCGGPPRPPRPPLQRRGISAYLARLGYGVGEFPHSEVQLEWGLESNKNSGNAVCYTSYLKRCIFRRQFYILAMDTSADTPQHDSNINFVTGVAPPGPVQTGDSLCGNSPPLEGCPKGGVVPHNTNTQLPKNPKRQSKAYFNLPYNPLLIPRARALRNANNLSEVLFWNEVKKGKFKGYDFDRQKVIGNYIVDFYCSGCGVVVEIDGKSHKTKVAYDAKRDAFLESCGLTMIHLEVRDIFRRMAWVMEGLRDHPAFLK